MVVLSALLHASRCAAPGFLGRQARYSGHWNNHWQGSGGYGTFPTTASAPTTSYGLGGNGGGNNPTAWGVGGWGGGSQWYQSGYASYNNPYNNPAVTTYFNYGQPIPVPAGAKLADADNPLVGLAIDKFRAADYAQALALVDSVIKIQPYAAAAHELRGLIQFALENYSAAASTIHSVLAIGPGWNWTTLSSVYSDMQLYKSQLAALEKYAALHPREPSARFLLAYHYITAGRTEDAKAQLEQVVAIVPGDKLAASLLRMVDHGAAQQAAQTPAGPSPDANLPPVDPAALVGDWHAKRPDGAVFDLELALNKTFTWKFTQEGQFQTVTGNYTLDKAILTLHGPSNGSMVAQVSVSGANRFTFKPLGGPSDDPGLTFAK